MTGCFVLCIAEGETYPESCSLQLLRPLTHVNTLFHPLTYIRVFSLLQSLLVLVRDVLVPSTHVYTDRGEKCVYVCVCVCVCVCVPVRQSVAQIKQTQNDGCDSGFVL